MPTLRLHRERLERKRKLSGYTVPALARELGISREHMYRIEWGVRRPSPKLYLQIKQALGVTGEELLDESAEGQCPSAATATGEASSPIPATTAGSRSRARSAAAPGASAASAAPSGDEGGAA